MSLSGTEITNCRLCDYSVLEDVIDFKSIPLGNDLNFSKEDSFIAEQYPLAIKKCTSCNHFQLSFSVNKEILYKKNYSYLSSIGKTFVDHLQWSCLDILSFQLLNYKINQMVVDIGSNDGTALSFFKEKGFKVLGIDPSELPVKKALENKINTINNFFSLAVAKEIVQNNGYADIIISHNVLAHVEDIKDIFKGIYHLLKQDGLFVFEIGYFGKMIETGIYDTIYHEHLDYHTLQPLINFLNIIGFSVVEAKLIESQGGSLRIYCKKLSKIENNSKNLNIILAYETNIFTKSKMLNWKIKIFENAKIINSILKKIEKNGGNIFAYGAPTKASLACKIIGIERDQIKYIVEDNSLKVGRYIPFWGFPIVSNIPFMLNEKDIIICFAWNFIKDIKIKIRKKYGKNIRIISSISGDIIKT